MVANPYAQYQKNQIETADQGKLLMMLYEGALRFLGRSRKALEEENLEEANNNLVRVQEIMAELMSSLDLESGEVAVSLFRIYEYMHYLLVEANIKKTAEPLVQVEKMLVELRDTWREALTSAEGAAEGDDKAGNEPAQEKKSGLGAYSDTGEAKPHKRVNISG